MSIQGVKKQLVIVCGQSNARGAGLVSDVVSPLDTSILNAYPNVPYCYKCDSNTDPPVYDTYSVASMGPRVYASINRFGVELTMMRYLDALYPGRWACGKYALDSTNLTGDWNPARGNFSDATPCPFTQLVNFSLQTEIDCAAELAAFVWIQGENDAQGSGTAAAYGTNLLNFITQLRSALGRVVPFVYGRLNSQYVAAGAFTVALQNEQARIEKVLPLMNMINQDGVALQGDNTHYPAAGCVSLGPLYAEAILSMGTAYHPAYRYSWSNL